MAEHTGVSKSTVQRWFDLFGVQPHRQRHFKISNDPSSSRKSATSSVSTSIPRTTPWCSRSMRRPRFKLFSELSPFSPWASATSVTHDYKRHGTTTLFAALDVATGRVITRCKPRHRHQEFLTFLRQIDGSVPHNLDVHLIVDNYATHKHPKVRAWLARRPRYHVHFTPTYASWLNQVEPGSASLPRRPFAEVPSPASRLSSVTSSASSNITTPTPVLSSGPPRPNPSSLRSNDFAHIFPGQYTRWPFPISLMILATCQRHSPREARSFSSISLSSSSMLISSCLKNS